MGIASDSHMVFSRFVRLATYTYPPVVLSAQIFMKSTRTTLEIVGRAVSVLGLA